MPDRIELTRAACPGLAFASVICCFMLVSLTVAGLGTTIWSFLACVLLGLLTAWFIWHEALLRSGRAITRLQVHHDQLLVFCRDGSELPVALADSTRLFARVALLNLCAADARLSPHGISRGLPAQILILNLPLCRNVDPEEFRRLRVWVRFHGTTH